MEWIWNVIQEKKTQTLYNLAVIVTEWAVLLMQQIY